MKEERKPNFFMNYAFQHLKKLKYLKINLNIRSFLELVKASHILNILLIKWAMFRLNSEVNVQLTVIV